MSMSMAGISCFQLNLALKVYSDTRARMAAESELNRALMFFVKDTPFGKDGKPDTWTDPYSGVTSRIIFAQGDIPYSTYNYYNTNGAFGWNGRNVPAESIHLIATGISGSSRKSIEMVVKKGIFPYAIATSSKIQSINAPLWTEGVKDTAGLLAGVKDLPGNITSNYSSGGNAIEAPKDSYVTGNVTAPGGIDIKMPSIILGGIKPGSSPVELPYISTSSLDPKDQVGVVAISSASLSSLKTDSINRSSGDLTIYGNLELDSALLFTEGDLTVMGKVIGSGALISKGSITIHQTSELAANNQVAIVADKDVTIAGQGSFMQGLVYTHGNFYGENFTLLGNLIAQSSDESKGQAILKEVKLVSNQQSSELSVHTPAYGGDAGGNLWHNVDAEKYYEGPPYNLPSCTLLEHFDIQVDGDHLANPTAFKTALTAAINNFDATTAAAMDNAAKPGTVSFHELCVNNGNPTDHVIAGSMSELYARIQSMGAADFLKSITGTNGHGAPVDPTNLDLGKIITGLFSHIKHNLDTVGPGNGVISGYSVITDLRLNKYITNARPTRITFQGELP